jgi:exosortase E/protease (VPEID-CTERM system)
VNTPASPLLPARIPAFGLRGRIATIAAVLTIETVLLSLLIQSTLTATDGIATAVHSLQHWVFRWLIAYAASWVLLITLRGGGTLAGLKARYHAEPVRLRFLALHLLFLAPLAFFSAALYGSWLHFPFVVVALGWHVCAVLVAASLFLAMAPRKAWLALLRGTGGLAAYAAVPALAAVIAINWSQRLWVGAARITFTLVERLLRPLLPQLYADPETRILGTRNFAVAIAEQCSGLEGVGLMLMFCCGWLWYFRREFRFPRALLVIPVALLLVFLLNAIRIAAIVLIGNAGHEQLAMIGFHSQAGWIAFNLVAFGVAIVARRSDWLSRDTGLSGETVAGENPASPYLMPLLTTLAIGMLVHALSSGFDLLYPLRFIGTGFVLWIFRQRYRELDWRFGWRGIAMGIAVYAAWVAVGRAQLHQAGMPQALADLPAPVRAAWILCRAGAAVLTVPLAEELAYRGYLMRRFAGAHFEKIALASVGWPALVASAVIFGAMHGDLWVAGSIAGLALGLVAKLTNRIGEAVAAHATANALIVGTVLVLGQWQWW